MPDGAHAFQGIDRVVWVDSSSIVVDKFVTSNEIIFLGHYPHFAILPGIYVLDIGLQAVERFCVQKSLQLGLTRVRSFRLIAPCFPGDIVNCNCSLRADAASTATFDLVFTVGKRQVAKGIAEYARPATQETLGSEKANYALS